MARLHGRNQQGNRLLGKLLAVGDTIRHRERGRELGFLPTLFLVDSCPLGLIAWS